MNIRREMRRRAIELLDGIITPMEQRGREYEYEYVKACEHEHKAEPLS